MGVWTEVEPHMGKWVEADPGTGLGALAWWERHLARRRRRVVGPWNWPEDKFERAQLVCSSYAKQFRYPGNLSAFDACLKRHYEMRDPFSGPELGGPPDSAPQLSSRIPDSVAAMHRELHTKIGDHWTPAVLIALAEGTAKLARTVIGRAQLEGAELGPREFCRVERGRGKVCTEQAAAVTIDQLQQVQTEMRRIAFEASAIAGELRRLPPNEHAAPPSADPLYRGMVRPGVRRLSNVPIPYYVAPFSAMRRVEILAAHMPAVRAAFWQDILAPINAALAAMFRAMMKAAGVVVGAATDALGDALPWIAAAGVAYLVLR